MIFDNFKIHATPFIADAYCRCGEKLVEVDNGFLSIAMYCPKCENIYTLKLIKVPNKNISKEYIIQCKEQNKRKK